MLVNSDYHGSGIVVIGGIYSSPRINYGSFARLTVLGNTSDNTSGALDIRDSGNTLIFNVRNDGNVGIGPQEANAGLQIGRVALEGLALNVSNVLFVNGSNNVGIGTSNPQNNLEIAGSVRFNSTNGCQGTCNKGAIAWNESNNKICVCVATNTWYYANLTA